MRKYLVVAKERGQQGTASMRVNAENPNAAVSIFLNDRKDGLLLADVIKARLCGYTDEHGHEYVTRRDDQ